MPRHKIYNTEQLKEKKKEWRSITYQKSKQKNQKNIKCKYCGIMHKTSFNSKFCSLTCSAKFQHTKPKLVSRKKLLSLWSKYHNAKARKATYERIIAMLYKEKWVNNKQETKYDLFTPNNLSND